MANSLSGYITVAGTVIAALAMGVCLSLGGCASYNSAAQGYLGVVQHDIQGVNDTAAKTWVDSACALPYGEVVRNGSGNPNLANAVIELCGGPAGITMIKTTPAASAITTIPTSILSVAPVTK